MSDLNKISTGSYDFNKWLYGGYEKGIITMIAGAPGCGKTNFCFLVSCSQAKKGKKVIFMDTEGGFSVERIKQLAGEDYEEILKNIFLLEPTSFEEQKKIFIKLLEKVKKEQIGLIVVDGMSMLYRLELGEMNKSEESNKIREINREVAKQMRALAEIARKQKIPVIITNQVYSSFLSEEKWKNGAERETNIVGGDLFKYWSKCIIELKGGSGKRRAVLLKHRSLPQKELSFEIFNEGVRKKGWI
jgi:DNA repair protein RadB